MLEERRRMRDPRIGEHHVEPSECRDHGLHEGLHLRGVTHVDADGDGLATSLPDFPGHGLGAIDLDISKRHQGALGLIVVMLVAVAQVHWKNGFFLNMSMTPGKGHGYEFNLALIGMALAVLVGGAGRYSVDRLIHAW